MAKANIKDDLFRITGQRDIKTFIKTYLLDPSFRYMFWFRFSNNHSGILCLYGKLRMRHYSFKFGYQFHAHTQIGKGFYIGHRGSIVINGRAKIGDNCNIAQGVTIGQTNRGDRKGYPTIGNRVWMGTQSVIVGKVTIGDNVLIAPLSYVNFDVPSNSIVIGNPAKIISRENATEGYINNLV
ncbi:MAG: serine acetyltransferase [Bacteroidales bacterium]|jgi:serine O-acetyltransferase|nr:serine acetyltransferase [Bacteroidales bacterium]